MSDLVDGVLITEPVTDPAPGIYVARATDPAYGWLEAMVEDGHASFLGERHEPDGSKLIAVALPGEPGSAGLLPNAGGSIRIGREFFTTALRDYHDWQEKWWREGIQNAVDAGATEVECRVEEQADGFAVTCADNGRGMDEDVLLNKFLVLGGTTKTAGDTRGGFGKAKELLVLPWLAWSVHTRDQKVVGVGIDYTVEPAPYRQGTEVRVVMPKDQTTSIAAAMAFIEKCYLPGLRFTVNGAAYRAKLAIGDQIRAFGDKAALYYDKRGKQHGLFVRTMGLFMFEQWVSDAVKGTLIVELTGSSVELLTANRDGLRDYELKRAIEQFVNELAANVLSALKKKQGLVREKFEGTGKFQGAPEREVRAEILSHMEELQPVEQTRRGLVLSDGQRELITNIVHRIGGGEGSKLAPDEAEGVLNMRPSGELAAAMLDGTVLPGPTAVENAVKQLAWEPDFFLINEVEGFHVPKMFYPASITPGMKKLARAWAELCRFVMIQLGCGLPFGVGFIFDTSSAAAYQKDQDDEHWLLLNPFRKPTYIGDTKPTKEALLGVVEDDDVNWLYAAAIHEVTHMADGITYHDESFTSAFTRNVARTANKERQVRAIVKAIKARGPRAEGAPRGPRVPRGIAAFSKDIAPLNDSDIEHARESAALDYRSTSPYVSFKNEYTSAWDYAGDLTALIRRSEEDVRTEMNAAFEIRETTSGKPVWRSSNFASYWGDMGHRSMGARRRIH